MADELFELGTAMRAKQREYFVIQGECKANPSLHNKRKEVLTESKNLENKFDKALMAHDFRRQQDGPWDKEFLRIRLEFLFNVLWVEKPDEPPYLETPRTKDIFAAGIATIFTQKKYRKYMAESISLFPMITFFELTHDVFEKIFSDLSWVFMTEKENEIIDSKTAEIITTGIDKLVEEIIKRSKGVTHVGNA